MNSFEDALRKKEMGKRRDLMRGRRQSDVILFNVSRLIQEGPNGPKDPNSIYAHDTFLVNSDGRNLEQISETAHTMWAPDGRSIVFTSSPYSDDNYQVVIMQTREGIENVVYNGYLEAWKGIFFKDGNTILTPRKFTKDDLKGILQIDTRSGRESYFYKNNLFDGELTVSPSGRYMIFSKVVDDENKGTYSQVSRTYLYDSRRNSLKRLPVIMGNETLWANDNLVFTEYADYGENKNYILKIDLNNADDVKILAKSDRSLWLEGLSRDGSIAAIYEASTDPINDLSNTVMLTDTRNGDVKKRLYNIQHLSFDFSKIDNKFVYCDDFGTYVDDMYGSKRELFDKPINTPKWQPR